MRSTAGTSEVARASIGIRHGHGIGIGIGIVGHGHGIGIGFRIGIGSHLGIGIGIGIGIVGHGIGHEVPPGSDSQSPEPELRPASRQPDALNYPLSMRSISHGLFALSLLVGCTNPASPCDEVCDGTIRCIDGNAACSADGFSGDATFRADCVRLCEAAGSGLTTAQETDALDCLECLRVRTDFAACNGETALDTVCRDVCRTDGAAAFRNVYGPAIFDAHPGIECLRR